MNIDMAGLRKDFPILQRDIQGKPLVYLDNAATTQKPQSVIDKLTHYYSFMNSNIHRGVHRLSQEATKEFEQARVSVQHFIHAEHPQEIIFTRGTTESINLVSSSFGKMFLKEGDEVLISAMEHHSNIVPWQMICEEKGAVLKVIPMDANGELIFDAVKTMLTDRTKIFAITHVSNALGTVNPIKELVRLAHQRQIPVLIDGAQGAAHMEIDVSDIDCDFYCFSGHKLYAPMGVGVLYGKQEWLEKLPPYQGGGEMISEVSFERTTYNELPYKFEAGTPSVGDVLGLDSAIKYINRIGWKAIEQHEEHLMQYTLDRLKELPEIRFFGQAKQRSGVISFLLGDLHPFDVGTLVDQMGVALRTGHHCAQPVMDFFGIPGTIRVSFALYTTEEDIDRMIQALKKAQTMLQ